MIFQTNVCKSLLYALVTYRKIGKYQYILDYLGTILYFDAEISENKYNCKSCIIFSSQGIIAVSNWLCCSDVKFIMSTTVEPSILHLGVDFFFLCRFKNYCFLVFFLFCILQKIGHFL